MVTTTAPKVEKRASLRAAAPRKRKRFDSDRFSFYRLLAAEMKRLTRRVWDPGYLSNLVTGTKVNRALETEGTLARAISNLAAKGIGPNGKRNLNTTTERHKKQILPRA